MTLKKKIRRNYFNNYSRIKGIVEPKDIENYLKNNYVSVVFHLGAISSTTFKDGNKIWLNNILLSSKLWQICSIKNIRLIYASSAATYGSGEKGFLDKNEPTYLNTLVPLNTYAWSKNEIDKRNVYSDKILNIKPPQWIGLKFFNVYGPNEFHKENMISIVLKTFLNIRANKPSSLFKSYKSRYSDGEQKRDFIYVKDCVKILTWLAEKTNITGIFNVGTGKARTFNDLVDNVYKNMNKNTNIKYIDMPESMKDKYQYITKADITSLKELGYKKNFFSLEEGVHDYINNHLKKMNNAIS